MVVWEVSSKGGRHRWIQGFAWEGIRSPKRGMPDAESPRRAQRGACRMTHDHSKPVLALDWRNQKLD